jgi:hypothetical protein
VPEMSRLCVPVEPNTIDRFSIYHLTFFIRPFRR